MELNASGKDKLAHPLLGNLKILQQGKNKPINNFYEI